MQIEHNFEFIENKWFLECFKEKFACFSSKSSNPVTYQRFDREIHATLHSQSLIHRRLALQYHHQWLKLPPFRFLRMDKIDLTIYLPLYVSISRVY